MKKRPQKIKEIIEKNIGTKCSVMWKQGRKTLVAQDCIIDSVYPEIFVVKYTEVKTGKPKIMTFSYTDILTEKVFLCKSKSDSGEKGA